MKRYILTGTPGSGKTSIITNLASKGYYTVDEAATDVIKHEQNLGITEPWKRKDFIDKIIVLQYERQIEAKNNFSEIQFYDRSPICTYALAQYLNFKSEKLTDEIERISINNIYEKEVFFIENLGFCEPSDARKISFEESLKFEQIHLDTYKKFGFECILVSRPVLDVRVQNILKLIPTS